MLKCFPKNGICITSSVTLDNFNYYPEELTHWKRL